MPKKIDYKTASKINWYGTFSDDTVFPGEEKINMACMQRIADATEAMAKNYVQMRYAEKYRENKAAIEKLNKQNAALKGHITRLKRISINK